MKLKHVITAALAVTALSTLVLAEPATNDATSATTAITTLTAPPPTQSTCFTDKMNAATTDKTEKSDMSGKMGGCCRMK